MRIVHADGFSTIERLNFRSDVYVNIMRSMKVLVGALEVCESFREIIQILSIFDKNGHFLKNAKFFKKTTKFLITSLLVLRSRARKRRKWSSSSDDKRMGQEQGTKPSDVFGLQPEPARTLDGPGNPKGVLDESTVSARWICKILHGARKRRENYAAWLSSKLGEINSLKSHQKLI